MIVDPDRYIDAFVDAGASILTIHAEASIHLNRSIQKIKSRGIRAGVALNPHTPVNVLSYVADQLDLVLIMSVNPGFGGQSFIESTYRKIKETRQLLDQAGSAALIEIDGGVSQHNAAALVQAGADVLVAGQAVFGASHPQEAILQLKSV